jgi:hypothetical protein
VFQHIGLRVVFREPSMAGIMSHRRCLAREILGMGCGEGGQHYNFAQTRMEGVSQNNYLVGSFSRLVCCQQNSIQCLPELIEQLSKFYVGDLIINYRCYLLGHHILHVDN